MEISVEQNQSCQFFCIEYPCLVMILPIDNIRNVLKYTIYQSSQVPEQNNVNIDEPSPQ